MPRKPREEIRKARNELYRSHILEAAERVFAEGGFEAAKVQDISERAGLSMGTIYGVFSGKEDLFRAILAERTRELLALTRTTVEAAPSPGEALDGLIEVYVRFFTAHPDFLRMHLRLGTSWVLGPTDDANGSQSEAWREFHDVQAKIFEEGIDRGAFADEPPAFLSKLFTAIDYALLSDWVATGMKASPEALVTRFQRIAARTFAASA